MTGFATHIKVGIENSETAEGERTEIRLTLEQLDQAILEATGGKARLLVGKFHNLEDEQAMSIADMKIRLVVQSRSDPRKGRIIAGWRTATEGNYPVHLVFDHGSHYCAHGDQLKEELGYLLETARVGRLIREFT